MQGSDLRDDFCQVANRIHAAAVPHGNVVLVLSNRRMNCYAQLRYFDTGQAAFNHSKPVLLHLPRIVSGNHHDCEF